LQGKDRALATLTGQHCGTNVVQHAMKFMQQGKQLMGWHLVL
jgi:hypothetical protein